MCEECRRRYDAQPDEVKDEVAECARYAAQGIVDALKRTPLNPLEYAVAAGIMARLWRAQLDEGVLAVVDDMVERGHRMTLAAYAAEGKDIRPRGHDVLEIRDEREAPEPRGAGRPARTPGAPVQRRHLRRIH